MWGPRRRGHPQRPPAYDGDDDVDDHHHGHNYIGDNDLCIIGVCLSLCHRNQEFHHGLPMPIQLLEYAIPLPARDPKSRSLFLLL